MARDAGSVVEELADLEVARAVVECCCQPDAAGGLTLAEIAARIDGAVDPRELERRLHVFVGLGMLQPYEDRRGTGRYVLDPRGLAGVQVAERITTQGGVSELLLLLDRTAAAIRASAATAVEVRAALERARLFFSLFADTLARKTRLGTIAELYEEVRGHEHQRLLVTLDELTKLVATIFAELEPLAHATLLEAQRYDRWLGQAAERVVSEAGAARDFGVLSPEGVANCCDPRTVGAALGGRGDARLRRPRARRVRRAAPGRACPLASDAAAAPATSGAAARSGR